MEIIEWFLEMKPRKGAVKELDKGDWDTGKYDFSLEKKNWGLSSQHPFFPNILSNNTENNI